MCLYALTYFGLGAWKGKQAARPGEVNYVAKSKQTKGKKGQSSSKFTKIFVTEKLTILKKCSKVITFEQYSSDMTKGNALAFLEVIGGEVRENQGICIGTCSATSLCPLTCHSPIYYCLVTHNGL